MDGTAPDPLVRIRDELVAGAARAKRRRVRRRRVSAVVALLGVFVVASAGAAVGDFDTGLGVVDRLLNTEGGGEQTTDRRQGPGTASEPLRLPDAPDGRSATAIAYLSRDGRICQVEAELRRSDGSPRGTSGAPCYGPQDLAQELHEKTAIVVAGSVGPNGQISEGFAASDVVRLRFYADDGAKFDAELTPPSHASPT